MFLGSSGTTGLPKAITVCDRQFCTMALGFNVFPSEVERAIWAHEDVLDCAVIGVPDEKWGEAVTAVVERKPGAEVGGEELIALCKAELGSIKAPKSVHFRELPRSTQGKVLKRTLRDEFWAGQERKV